MPNLLVTGGAGFIGANFVRHWHASHSSDTVVVLDALTYAGNRANLAGIDVPLIEASICDTDRARAILREHDIDTIVHFAAESHVDRSIDGPDAFIETNVVGTHSLLKAAKAEWLDTGTGRDRRFHHVSTDEVYGSLGADDPAFSETTAYAPNSPYSASKAASDHLVRAYHHTLRAAHDDEQLLEQLRPLSIPRKADPAFPDQLPDGKTASYLWRRDERTRLAACRGSLSRYRAGSGTWRIRRNV
jgi:dTDP-glucose 4,6-dehydratase